MAQDMAEVSAVLLIDRIGKLISSNSPKRHAMPPSSPFLPRELKDEVFSHLVDDKRTLCLCAALNHEWAPSAKAALFHTIVIDNDTSDHDIFAFREWLGSDDISGVANHVRKLYFKGIRTRRNVDTRLAFSAAVIRAVDIAEAFHQLPAVHSLQFERTALQSSEVLSQCPPFRSLKRLDMDCTFYDLSPPSSGSFTHPTSGLVQILNLFSTIDVLRVSHVTPYRVSEATSVADAVAVAAATGRQLSPVLDVRRFISHGSLTESHRILFEMLASWPKLSTETGSMKAMEVVDKASAFNSLVRSAGSHLTHLSLRLAEERIPEDPKVRRIPHSGCIFICSSTCIEMVRSLEMQEPHPSHCRNPRRFPRARPIYGSICQPRFPSHSRPHSLHRRVQSPLSSGKRR